MSDTGIVDNSPDTHVQCLKAALAVLVGLWMLLLWLIPMKIIAFLLVILIAAIVIGALRPVIVYAVQEHRYVSEEQQGAVP